MKKFILSLVALMVSIGIYAQTTQQQAIEKIASANAKYTSVTCPFTKTAHMAMMEKALVSKGKLTFSRPDKLKMEYSEPAGNLLDINGDSFVMVNGKRKMNLNTRNDNRYANLKNTLLLSVGGDVQGVANENNAEIKYLETPKYYVFILTKGKGAKSQYVKLELSYSKKDFSLCVMKMEEANGNYTVYDTPVKEFSR